ncbi:hypothetical protein [Streptomyces sp. NPDC058623]|uniref:hypothetical protein n=1 Tax=Streptomyces sp. NPDC058623 TaxID=3346563 RepID=UPI0036660405
MAGRWRVRAVVAGVVAVCVLGVGGCAGGDADAKAAARPSVAPVATVIGVWQAQQVFDRYVAARGAAVAGLDGDGFARVETGPLLAESLAVVEARRKRKADWEAGVFRRPEFLIPAERDQPGYPRTFVALSRGDSPIDNPRARALHYFVQEAAGAEWKAAVLSWVYDTPRKAGVFEDNAAALHGYDVRPREVAAFVRGAGGEAALSPRAGADREVCGRYAEWMSFTAPEGGTESADFVPGPLTSGVVEAANAAAGGNWRIVTREQVFAPAAGGVELPVVRLADGKALVTCAFTRTDRWTGDRSVTFPQGGVGSHADVEVLLGAGEAPQSGGESRRWRRTTVRWSVTVTLEVPERGPAEAVACNCLRPRPLSAEGDPE